MIIFFITSILGFLRDYSKYKQFNFYKFIRSPLLTFIIYYIFYNNINIIHVLILERWIMLIYKTIISINNNDYQTKKEKYKIKYNIKYKN